ncbi:DUF2793 domain-containing protein [Alphaproteobacteria bacterium GH1-50]|uniref:DUF2793 domain-containing protein n=1 Tax=Kangsaoukella pontilimi TaxID=2691042 RepID=A0A7C9MCJ7_9RHOB|nr:DUF2793 domain-containing protein [Kangsaoukella pontilimi]MXQ07631.1 DUF2793 domain-containing protein [Kangsaoukella pontilimi]
MTSTVTLGLPFVEAAQAQKHVTVNEAFQRLDALTQMTLAGTGASVPPVAPGEGEVHAVGAGASGAWFGFDGALALYQNGGWDSVTPVAGWRAWDAEAGAIVTFDGVEWVPGLIALSGAGAAFAHRTADVLHSVGGGPVSTVTAALPDGALVLGVSLRVVSSIGGASSFDLGVSGAATRFAMGVSSAAGATAATIRDVPQVYPGGGDIVLTAKGGSFNGTGQVWLAIHLAELTPPRA